MNENINKNLLKEIILEQEENQCELELGIEREILTEIKKSFILPHAIIISGLRRCGKSTLLRQIRASLEKESYYFNFEDERLLSFKTTDFNALFEVLIELEGEKKVFFLDEIQNVPDWEKFVRRMIDRNFKFFLTGSNASLLSRELGTRLTGRQVSFNLTPFSFIEYLKFKKHKFQSEDLLNTSKRANLKKYFNQYLSEGGMPEYLTYQNIDLLKSVYTDILYRDILVRYNLKEEKILRELMLYLLSNSGSLFSLNKLKNLLNLGSLNTVKSYIGYLENSFLLATVNLYSPSLKVQIFAPQKVYCNDNAFIRLLAFQFSENKGRFLENLVFQELKRRQKEVFYFKTKQGKEIDFLIKDGLNPLELIQVSWSLNDQSTLEREISALFEAMSELDLKKSLILTDNETGEWCKENKIIQAVPTYQWLLK